MLFAHCCLWGVAGVGQWRQSIGGIHLNVHEGMVDCLFSDVLSIREEFHFGCGVGRSVYIDAIL